MNDRKGRVKIEIIRSGLHCEIVSHSDDTLIHRNYLKDLLSLNLDIQEFQRLLIDSHIGLCFSAAN